MEVTGPGTTPTGRLCSAAVCGVEGTGPKARLDDDRPGRHGGDQAVPEEEAGPRRRGAGRHLGDDGARLDDPTEQAVMGDRVGPVDPSGQHRDRHPVHSEGAPVGRGIDAEGCSRDDGEPTVRDPGSEVGRNEVAVRRAAAGADHRDGPSGQDAQVGRAAHPQADRRGVEVVDAGRPVLVPGTHDPGSGAVGDLEIALHVETLGSQAEGLHELVRPLERHRERGDGPVGADERERARVSRLGQPAPRRASATVLVQQRTPADAHAAIASCCLMLRARPMWSAVGRSSPRRSLRVQASLRHRS